MILRYLFRNLCSISMFELEAVPVMIILGEKTGKEKDDNNNIFARA